VLGTLGFLWRGRLAGGALGVEVSTLGHCIASLVTAACASPLGGRVLAFCIECRFEAGKLGAGNALGLGFGGARFRFCPPSGAVFVATMGDGRIFKASDPWFRKASSTARSSGLSSSVGGMEEV
jgi:hypothetical protein